MKPIVTQALRAGGSIILGIIEAIAARREARRRKTAREVLAEAPTSIPEAQRRAREAMYRRHEADRRARETGLPEVDQAVRDMLQGVRRTER